jgi:hypothetical protein
MAIFPTPRGRVARRSPRVQLHHVPRIRYAQRALRLAAPVAQAQVRTHCGCVFRVMAIPRNEREMLLAVRRLQTASHESIGRANSGPCRPPPGSARAPRLHRRRPARLAPAVGHAGNGNLVDAARSADPRSRRSVSPSSFTGQVQRQKPRRACSARIRGLIADARRRPPAGTRLGVTSKPAGVGRLVPCREREHRVGPTSAADRLACGSARGPYRSTWGR